MEGNKQFRKNFIWNTLGTGFNAFNSLFFMIIATRVNGVSQAGIFSIAFSTACILFAVGIYAGRIYQVTELDKNISDKDFIINRIITSLSMIVLLIIFCIFKGYEKEKFLIFLLLTIYKALEAFSDVIYGVLQKNNKLEIAGKSLFAKSIFSVIIFTVLNILTHNMIISIVAMILLCIGIICFYDFRKAYRYIDLKIKVNSKNVLKIFKAGFFVFAISFLGMYVVNAPKYSIDTYLESDIQTIFGIIVMPATIVSLVAQFLIHPYLNNILELYKKRDLVNFKKLVFKLISMIFAFGVISTLFLYLFGTQILGIIYGLDLSMYKVQLAIIIIASTLYTIGTVYSSILTTVRETFSQFIIYIGVAIGAYIISNLMTSKLGLNGSIISYFCIMIVQSLAYMIYTNVKLKKIFASKEENDEKSDSCNSGI